MQSYFSVAIPSRDILGESPWWCNKEQVLWRVDILSKCVFKWDYNTNTQNTWRLKDKVGCFVKTQHKNIALVALSDGVHLLHLEENRTEHLAPLEGPRRTTCSTTVNATGPEISGSGASTKRTKSPPEAFTDWTNIEK